MAYKYQISSSFGVSESCTNEGEETLSQIRFYVDPQEITSHKPLIPVRDSFYCLCLGWRLYQRKAQAGFTSIYFH